MKQREKLCAWMFEVTKKPYAKFFKRNKKAWGLNSTMLLTYPAGTLGNEVGNFLRTNKFELLPKLESHDVYHVITGMSTQVKDEVGMQFLLLGNGKKSLYLFSTIGICIFLLPEYFNYFRQCYKKGKTYHPIFQLDLKEELNNQLTHLRWRLRKSRTNSMKTFNLLNDHQ
jgi:ubiquinone biosynthesis protein Coq4